jgi:toxin ParE1/3/4
VKVEWHPFAQADLIELLEYVAADNPEAAYRVHDELLSQIEVLEKYPAAGRPGRVAGTRELVITGLPYIAAYRIDRRRVTILRLLHGAQKWPKKL